VPPYVPHQPVVGHPRRRGRHPDGHPLAAPPPRGCRPPRVRASPRVPLPIPPASPRRRDPTLAPAAHPGRPTVRPPPPRRRTAAAARGADTRTRARGPGAPPAAAASAASTRPTPGPSPPTVADACQTLWHPRRAPRACTGAHARSPSRTHSPPPLSLEWRWSNGRGRPWHPPARSSHSSGDPEVALHASTRSPRRDDASARRRAARRPPVGVPPGHAPRGGWAVG